MIFQNPRKWLLNSSARANQPGAPLTATSRTSGSWRINLLLLVGSALLSLILVEWILTWMHYPRFNGYTSSPCCGSALMPRSQGWWLKEGRDFIRISHQGLRDVEHTLQAPPNAYRIAILGDSYAEALQLPMEQTFWWILGKRLNGCDGLSNRRVEVFNYGVSGYGTANELQTLRHRVWPFSPDLVLLAVTTGNDIRNNHRDLDGEALRPYYWLKDGQLILDDRYLQHAGLEGRQDPDLTSSSSLAEQWLERFVIYQILSNSALALRSRLRASSVSKVMAFVKDREWDKLRGSLFRFMGWNEPATPTTPDRQTVQSPNAQGASRVPAIQNEPGLDNKVYLPPAAPVWQEAWEVTEALILQMDREVRARNAMFFLTTLSSGIQVLPDPKQRKRFMESLAIEDLFFPDHRLARLAEANGIPYKILAPELLEWAEANQKCVHGFDNSHPDAPCGGHWNAHGHRVAGELLAKKICASLPLPPKASGR